jgi:cytidyltransferase-like protein
MILGSGDLRGGIGPVTMVSGHFDPLHPGHIEYFVEARRLGLPLLCCVSSDGDVRRKHEPLLTQDDRGRVIAAIAMIDYVYLARDTTAECLRAVRPRFLAKGADWRGRLPEEEVAACRELNIEIAFLDTVRRSSSAILREFMLTQNDKDIRRLEAQRAGPLR